MILLDSKKYVRYSIILSSKISHIYAIFADRYTNIAVYKVCVE